MRPSSANLCTIFTRSRRRSSFICGSGTRIIAPCVTGSSPSSASRIAFSITLICDLSNGVTVSRRGSGAARLATWFSIIIEPYTSTRTVSSMLVVALLERTDANSCFTDSIALSMCARASFMICWIVLMANIGGRVCQVRVAARLLFLHPDPRSHLLPADRHGDGAWAVNVQNDQRQVVFLTKRHRGLVHHAQFLEHNVAIADPFVERRVRILLRVRRVDAVDTGRLDDDVGLHLDGPQCRGGVGRKVRIARAAGKNHDAALLEMAKCAPPDIGLGQLFHPDRCHDTSVQAPSLHDVLERERIDDRAEHAHVIGGDTIHTHLGELPSAYDVATADHHPNADAHVDDSTNLVTELANAVEVETGALLSGEGLAGELQQDPPEDRLTVIGHQVGY